MHDSAYAAEARRDLPADVVESRFYSDDLAPVPTSHRTWSTYAFAALWISMCHCIPTYTLAGGMIADGMNWWQALLTIGTGTVIVLVPILANAHPGTRYGLPFPVLARASFGTTGANVPAMLVVSHVTHREIYFGLNGANDVILLLTLAVSVVTFASGRTNVLQGAVHVILFAAFVMLIVQG